MVQQRGVVRGVGRQSVRIVPTLPYRFVFCNEKVTHWGAPFFAAARQAKVGARKLDDNGLFFCSSYAIAHLLIGDLSFHLRSRTYQGRSYLGE
jgi:hypothetical protein